MLRSILVGTAGLSVLAGIAGCLAFSRSPLTASSARRRALALAAAAAIVAQCAHAAEELGAGFPRRFPAILGLAPWPNEFFILFNLFWIVVWALSCRAAIAGWRAALFPLWFLALASMANAVAHPLLSARAGAYFPGLFTSPLVGIMGILLARQLLLATAPAAAHIVPRRGAID